MQNNGSLPLLHGLRILDMATVLAAPFSATLCGDLGADVVKLELPDGSDALRGLAPVKDTLPLYWKTVNRGKRGITLDVRKPRGRELLLGMLKDFDVVVENFRSGTLDRWGLTLEAMHAVNSRLVVLRLTGFGQTGPYRQRPGFARIFEAMSGLTNLIGTPESGPQHPNFPIGDVIAGVFGAFSIAAALARLRADPLEPGFEVDLSATEAVFRLLDPLAVEYEQLGLARSRAGNRASYTAPSNMYRSADGKWVTLVASSDMIFARLCTAMEMPDLPKDPRFNSNPARCLNLDELDGRIAAWFGARDFAALQTLLDAAQVPYTKVYGIEDVLADPQVQAREGVIRLADSDLGTIPAPCVVPRVPGRDHRPLSSGPAVGEHNASFYGGLGIDAEELRQLREEGVI